MKITKRFFAALLSLVLLITLVTLPVAAEESAQQDIKGDVTGDRIANSSDVLMVLQHVVKKIELTDKPLQQADVNKDGFINSSDALVILRICIGLEETNPSDKVEKVTFSLNLANETSTQVVIEVKLERGSFCAVDFGVTYNAVKVKKCINIVGNIDIALASGVQQFYAPTGLSSIVIEPNYDKTGGILATYTFEKVAGTNISKDDFELNVTNCSSEFEIVSNIHVCSYKYSVTKAPTCTEDGIITYTCSYCGDTYTEIIPKSHNYKHISVPSTCTVSGMEYDICSDCGAVINLKVLPFKPHSWSEWKIVREATAALEGLKERSCTVCGTTEEELISKLNVIVDDESGISIEFNDEYDSGVEIKVEEVFDGDSFQILDLYHGNNQSVIFDITTEKDGEKVQPNGKVKVRVPIPEGFDTKNLFVCYVDSTNGTVTNIPATIVDGYIEFFADHFSYYAIVEKLGKVNSVSIDDISMSYKDSATITPNINVDAGVDCNVTYSSSNTDVVSIDANGRVTTNDKGSATITVTVTDEYGNTVTDTCKVNVSYKWWQWIIVIVLFGWIWY